MPIPVTTTRLFMSRHSGSGYRIRFVPLIPGLKIPEIRVYHAMIGEDRT
jgi:hypothetical protein